MFRTYLLSFALLSFASSVIAGVDLSKIEARIKSHFNELKIGSAEDLFVAFSPEESMKLFGAEKVDSRNYKCAYLREARHAFAVVSPQVRNLSLTSIQLRKFLEIPFTWQRWGCFDRYDTFWSDVERQLEIELHHSLSRVSSASEWIDLASLNVLENWRSMRNRVLWQHRKTFFNHKPSVSEMLKFIISIDGDLLDFSDNNRHVLQPDSADAKLNPHWEALRARAEKESTLFGALLSLNEAMGEKYPEGYDQKIDIRQIITSGNYRIENSQPDDFYFRNIASYWFRKHWIGLFSDAALVDGQISALDMERFKKLFPSRKFFSELNVSLRRQDTTYSVAPPKGVIGSCVDLLSRLKRRPKNK